jgi:hypothetical protein
LASTPSHGSLLQLLHAQADAVGFLVDLDDLHLDGLADRQDLGRMVDAAPRHVGDVQQAVDAAEIDEGTVFGDVLDHAVDSVAFGEALDEFGALFGAGFFQDRTARHDDVAAALVHLEDLERLLDAHQRAGRRAPGGHRPASRGRKATAPPRSTVKPPLTGRRSRLRRAFFVGFERLHFQTDPGFLRGGPCRATARLRPGRFRWSARHRLRLHRRLRLFQRSHGSLAVPFVAALQIFQNRGVICLIALGDHLVCPAPRPCFRAGRDKQLYRGIWADDRTDIPAVQNGTWRSFGKLALQVDQLFPQAAQYCDPGCCLTDFMGGQNRLVYLRKLEMLRDFNRDTLITKRQALCQECSRHGPVSQARVEVAELEMFGEPPCKRAFS